ncbi:MAG: poly-gamma-glutamate biosynthesis protein PgsC/CapC [Planctomycetales bacterium]|nr:poly-gamma-glutamate biosynthesis protein PgsC/CapC [Planctomycetales bacterium]
MNEWVIPIFPPNGVAITMTTTVWIGVLIVIFFNLRFGWTLSGLVIPGYVVPLIIAKPTAACVIFGEAILTYWIVYVMSEWPHYVRGWSSFFGRDRFFVIVIVSVVVRCLFDGWWLPWAAQEVNEQLGIAIDYRHDLHSYGLIIVALIANYFWKPGLFRGSVPLATSVVLCYLVVQYGMARFTNFNLGSLQYLYDDIASSLLSSPKAYIVILTTAFVASWLNLRFSWEFNGILVPALLALLWHDPMKIVVSLVEAGVIFGLASVLLRLPLWKKTTMEGGRKIAFFFSVCFAYRAALAHIMPLFFPDFLTTDAFGFGYLLTSLMAMKAHDKKLTIRLIKATLQASMVGAALASAIGFALLWVGPGLRAAPDSTSAARIVETNDNLVDLLRTDKVRFYETRQPDTYRVPVAGEISSFEAGLRWLEKYLQDGEDESFNSAQRWLHAANYEVLRVQDRYIYLREMPPNRGWGVYVLDTQTDSPLVVEVPAPLNEWGTVESAISVFQKTSARGLAVWGADRFSSTDRSSDPLIARNTTLRSFARVFGEHSTVEVRGYTPVNIRAMVRGTGRSLQAAVDSSVSSLWVQRDLPSGLRPKQLQALIGEFDVEWERIAEQNVLRRDVQRGFASLFLDKPTRQRLVSNLSRLSEIDSGAELSAVRFEHGSLAKSLLASKSLLATRGSNAYVPSTVDEMLFLDEEVLSPLIQILGSATSYAELSADERRLFHAAGSSAEVLGYEVVVMHDDFREQDYLVLQEPAPRQRHWGTYVFRFGLKEPRIVQVPRPLLERSSFEFGVQLFERPAASALFIAGANPRANTDGSSDVTRLANRINPYNLVQQVFLREMQSRQMLIIQSRAIQAPVDADIVVAVHDGTTIHQHLSQLMSDLLKRLKDDRMTIRFVDGGEDVAGYEIGLLLQSSTLNHTMNKQLASLWLSPTVRARFQQQDSSDLQHAEFESVGIPSIYANLYEQLAPWQRSLASPELPAELFETLVRYAENRDIILLRAAVANWPDWQITRIVDDQSGQAFIVVSYGNRGCPFAINLSSQSLPAKSNQSLVPIEKESVRAFLDARSPWCRLLPIDEEKP